MDALAFCYSFVAQSIFYGAWRAFELRARGGAAESAAERKRRAWALSLAVSGLWSFVLAPYFSVAFFWHFAAERESFLAWCAQDTPLLRGLALHFFAFLVLDCAVGWVDYREHQHPVTSWAHHVSYIVLLCCLLYNRTPVLFLCVPARPNPAHAHARSPPPGFHSAAFLQMQRSPPSSSPLAASFRSTAATFCSA